MSNNYYKNLEQNSYLAPASAMAAFPKYGNSCFVDRYNRVCTFLDPYKNGGRARVVCSDPMPPIQYNKTAPITCNYALQYSNFSTK